MIQLAEQVPNRAQVERALGRAAVQIESMERAENTASIDEPTALAADAFATAAIVHLLQALAAALDGLNQQLPDPLPATRLSRRNLRDRFTAVESECEALREIERHAHEEEGWLGRIECQARGSTFAPLVCVVDDRPAMRILRDPLVPELGQEPGSASAYLTACLERMTGLINAVAAHVPDDVRRYQEAARLQARRLI